MPRGIWLDAITGVTSDAFFMSLKWVRYGGGTKYEKEDKNENPYKNEQESFFFHVDFSPLRKWNIEFVYLEHLTQSAPHLCKDTQESSRSIDRSCVSFYKSCDK